MRLRGEDEVPACCCPLSLGRVCDGVAQVRQAARDELRKGAHQIKIMASGGVSSPTDKLTNLQVWWTCIWAILSTGSIAITMIPVLILLVLLEGGVSSPTDKLTILQVWWTCIRVILSTGSIAITISVLILLVLSEGGVLLPSKQVSVTPGCSEGIFSTLVYNTNARSIYALFIWGNFFKNMTMLFTFLS